MKATKTVLVNYASLCFLPIFALGTPVASAGTNASMVTTTPTVNLGYATYQGILVQDTFTNQTNTNFLGVRYAAAPTGTYRFRAARAPGITPGLQMANTQPAECPAAPQATGLSNPFNITTSSSALRRSFNTNVERAANVSEPEDCLFLNVYVPGHLDKQKRLPVIFWIHGGGYTEGSASMFTGNDILRESGGGVVLVVVQYRLGVFGFLPGQKVKDDGLLNAGLLDQQFALQWVQKHITQLGGDPTKVTIWGESAGAGSVIQHLVANDGHTTPPLFRAAMTSSTFLPPQYAFNDRIPELLYNEVITRTNCSSASDSLECLRSVDFDILQAVNIDITSNGFFGTFVFAPVVDGTFITARPTKLLQERKLNVKFLQSVTNAFEGTIIVNQSTADSVSQHISNLFPTLSASAVQKATALYAGLGTKIFQINAITGESTLICPTYLLMKAFGGNAFKGEFAVPPGFHGEDINFYFPSSPINFTLPAPGSNALARSLSESDTGSLPPFALSDVVRAFSESFTNFAMSLNPNVKFDPSNITPAWKLWSGSNEMLFNRTVANAIDVRAVTTSKALLQRCAFWESVAAQTAQ
ncbi:alpha/beta-hydrolase [Pholiota conissans]|uniref:Alpha/beta-hydrolase n=1 Tax=Pholiota conissans TaxID=109636 RepID=A0A9P6CU10_9AGAR|nr:alpha/beta-hydrolase [Pholiota conissans]